MTDAMRERALAARAAGDREGAIAAWHAMLDLAPDDWRLALELKREIRVAWGQPDSDGRFRRAARSLPDELWVEHYAFFNTLHGAELAGIERRARGLLPEWGGDARVWAILGDAAAHGRDWGAAEEAYAAAAALGREGCAEKLARARLYRRLEARGWADTGPAYRLMVINLDRATERMAEMRARLAGAGPELERVAAVDGARLEAGEKRGTLGCLMSHVSAWERLLAGDEACALVLEDDVVPLLALPGRLGGLGLPEAWDVVWVNDRTVPRLDVGAQGFGVMPLAGTVQGFWPDTAAAGTDGYLVSRAGAQKLLDRVARDGMAGDVDWRMVAYGMTAAEIAAIPDGVRAKAELGRMPGEKGGLRCFVLQPPLIQEVGLSSQRQDLDGP